MQEVSHRGHREIKNNVFFCFRFDTYVGGPADAGGVHEKGVYCTCTTDLCNRGTIDDSDEEDLKIADPLV